MQNILITGAAGKIGNEVTSFLSNQKNYQLRLSDLNISALEGYKGIHEVIPLNVSDLNACQEALKGIDIVIHLAGDPSPDADFYQSLLENNIKGTYNIFRASKDNSVSKVIFASSAQTIENYPLDYQIHPFSPVRPKNMYGVSKCFGEAVAAYFAYTEGLQSIAIRIGAYDDYKEGLDNLSARDMSAYLSPRDFNDLLLQSLAATDLSPFSILHGVSNNRFKRLNLEETKGLVGYSPKDDAFELNKIPLFDH
ncbi:NAD-dependent epimerase/dehydratase family protein [Bacillus sp. 2205SS5-2]|uniref:NAD-dependent epimerase/dehydratase family protein n=1 Tax=Bacillus sp. 2205SS5-2 TaxID=3109031 RepID=UPI003004B871